MPGIHFRKTVDADPEAVYDALATQEGLAGNWTDQLAVPEEPGEVARFGFGPDWAKQLEVRIDALEPGRRIVWTPVGGFPGWVGTSIEWELTRAEGGGTVVQFRHTGWPEDAADGEMAMCGYTWAMIIDRLAAQVADGRREPYFTAGAPLPR
jgi:uncharacterized protein YndB with AHSA1/START domain